MIVFIYGTTAEAIKLAPISRRLQKLGIPQQHWLTFQHTEALSHLMPALGLPSPDVIIADGANGRSLKTRRDALQWLFSCSKWSIKNTKSLRNQLPKNTVIIVHGDTMTSVVGAVIGKMLRRPVAHVEAGLRSGNWRHPFPEEIDRKLVGALAEFHYAPSDDAVTNLRGKSGVVHTGANTVVDAVLDSGISKSNKVPIGLILLHRFEFISNSELVLQTLKTLSSATKTNLVILVDAYSRKAIEEALNKIDHSNIKIKAKVPHQEFVSLLSSAEFIVTDSGGIQEEAALLGIPTMIHRVATERNEGIGRNVRLSGWDQGVLADFVSNPSSYRHQQMTLDASPSDIIVEDLVLKGFASE